MKKIVKPTKMQRYHAMKKLQEVCHTDENGCAVYDEGWGDAEVAAAAIPDYQGDGRTMIGDLRRETLGTYKPRAPAPALEPAPACVSQEAFDAQVAKLAAVTAWLDRTHPGWEEVRQRELRFPVVLRERAAE